jgi:hypothetical protein
MATAAQYAGVPKVGVGSITAGDTSRTAPSAAVTIFSAGTSGSRIDNVDCVATGTTVASVLRLFLYDGTTYRLWQEILVPANTPSASIPVWTWGMSSAGQGERMPLILPTLWSLRAALNDAMAGGVQVIARGADF